jgi:DNA modification methylase
VREGKTGHWQGDRTQTTVWEIANNNPFGNQQHEESWGHGTQKPVECMRRPIVNNSRPGQVVYDPFLGSGTSLIAAEMTGRICFGLEISPGHKPTSSAAPRTSASMAVRRVVAKRSA